MCNGKTLRGVKCKLPGDWCHLHISQKSSNKKSKKNSIKIVKVNDREKNNCVICSDSIHVHQVGHNYTLGCSHIYHKNCIKKWASTNSNAKCPLCRTEISGKDKKALGIDNKRQKLKDRMSAIEASLGSIIVNLAELNVDALRVSTRSFYILIEAITA